VYHQTEVKKVIKNAVIWAAPSDGINQNPDRTTARGINRPEPLEPLI
jgi:trehalose utilization protein